MTLAHVPTLYLLCGRIAAGKSTLARRLAVDVPDTICRQRLRERNAGGAHPFQVSEAEYDLFTSYFVPPGPDEGFNVVIRPA